MPPLMNGSPRDAMQGLRCTLSLGLDSGEELKEYGMRAIPSLPIIATRFKLCSYRYCNSGHDYGGLYVYVRLMRRRRIE